MSQTLGFGNEARVGLRGFVLCFWQPGLSGDGAMKLTEPQYSIVHLPPGRPLGQSRLSALACRCRDSAAHHASSPASTVLPATEVSLGAWHPLQGVPLPCCHCGGPTVLNSVNSQFPPAFGKVLSPEPSTKMRATHTQEASRSASPCGTKFSVGQLRAPGCWLHCGAGGTCLTRLSPAPAETPYLYFGQ